MTRREGRRRVRSLPQPRPFHTGLAQLLFGFGHVCLGFGDLSRIQSLERIFMVWNRGSSGSRVEWWLLVLLPKSLEICRTVGRLELKPSQGSASSGGKGVLWVGVQLVLLLLLLSPTLLIVLLLLMVQ